MKKIELHLHFDGSIDVNYTNQLMHKDCKNLLVSNDSKNLTQYLDKFSLPISLLQDINNIEIYAEKLAKDLVKDDVIYAEVRFCPLFHLEKYKIDDVIYAIRKGFQHIKGIKINLIFCMMRNFSYEKNLEIIDLTSKFLNKGVVGIDLAGDEHKYKTEKFEKLFKIIRDKNIPFTIHAGEADNYTSVNSALRFGAKRIGHGVNSIQNIDTIKEIIKNNVVLEICPKSNLDTNVVSNIKLHPAKKLLDMGVKISINTDNRTVSNTNLDYEYSLLKNNLGFTDQDLINCNLNAIDAAFISEKEKDKLRKELFK